MSSYEKMEEVLQLINQKYITLPKENVAYNNRQLKLAMKELESAMKEQCKLFEKLFERIFYGGSFYDDLKISSPNEYDLDLVLTLPKSCDTCKIKNCRCVSITESDKPGWLWFKIKEGFCTGLNKYIVNGYLNTESVLNYFKSLIYKSVDLLKSKGDIEIEVEFYSQSGPAMTLCIPGIYGEVHVDLTLAFKFGPNEWPKDFRQNTSQSKSEFFLIPKTIKESSSRHWRASFQEQERELILKKERLKPALRLLKKMRTNLKQESISSYYLKTIVLWEVNSINWKLESLSSAFMKLLKKYKNALYSNNISYYWNSKYNLLVDIKTETLINHHNEIDRKISLIERNYSTNPLIVAKVILKEGTEEYNEFINDPNIVMKYQSLSNSDEFDDTSNSINNDQSSVDRNLAIFGGLIGGAVAAGIGFMIYKHVNRNRDNRP